MEISVVILNWNDLQHLTICLESLSNCTKERSLEIIVVDNDSTDGSADVVATRFPEVKLIRNQENLGFPKGNNIGMRASQGKYIYLLNSDIKIIDGCIDTLANYMDEHPDVGMLGPKILNADLSHQSSCRRFPTLWNNFCTAMGLSRAFRQSRFFSGEHMLYFTGDKTLDVDVLVGCFWVVRRKALDEFGLLDEGFFIYAEDVDWCKRCWKTGWRVVFFPGAEAIHYRGVSTTKKDPVRFAVTQQRSVLRYWKKHHGSLGRFSMACLTLCHLSARSGIDWARYAFQPSRRKDIRVRLQVARARLHALFINPLIDN
jgi:GT2 family glycosyltransferase